MGRIVDLERLMEERYRVLHYLENCVTLFHGQMGSGKTTNAVAISHWMRELFELPVLCVGTSLGLKPGYGPYQHMPTKAFVEQLLLMSQIAEEIVQHNVQDVEAYLAWCKKTRGLTLHRCILLVDEMQNYCPSRQPHNRLNQAILNFIAQMRHYHCTMIAMTPNPLDVDRKVREQIRWLCKPDLDPASRYYTNRMRGPQGRLRLRVYAPDYYDMFDSWAFTGFNAKSLQKVLEKDV
jgi:hypothetical protein